MQAIRVHEAGGPEVLRHEEIPDVTPGPGEALVRLEAIGVNFVDIYRREGLYSVQRPFTPGGEGAGTIVALGEDVVGLRVGDRVASHALRGAYAELAVAPAEQLVVVPEGVSAQQAAALMLQGLTAHYLATSAYPLSSVDACLVHAAAGGVGLLLCQIASQRGARVIGTVSTPQKEELARAAGANAVIRYTEQDFVSETRRLTDERGVQVVYDSVGLTTFEGSLDCLVTRGMLVLFGQSSGPVPPVDLQVLNSKGSLFVTRPSLPHYVMTRDELVARASDLFDRVLAGSLELRVDRKVPLSDAADAHRALEQRETTGKVLLIP